MKKLNEKELMAEPEWVRFPTGKTAEPLSGMKYGWLHYHTIQAGERGVEPSFGFKQIDGKNYFNLPELKKFQAGAFPKPQGKSWSRQPKKEDAFWESIKNIMLKTAMKRDQSRPLEFRMKEALYGLVMDRFNTEEDQKGPAPASDE